MGKTETALSRRTNPLTSASIARFADHLMKIHGHLQRFEIELCDRTMTEAISMELAGRGCIVEADPFKARLDVSCPESILNRAA